jgi:Kelch motif protein
MMKQRHLFALGLLVVAGLLVSSVPALAAPHLSPAVPDASVLWKVGPSLPFAATRWDGAYVSRLNRVYFLGFRAADATTDGSVWYYDVATGTYVDTGVVMQVPVSNYQIAELRDAHGIGLYIFGGRDGLGNLVDTVQAFYPGSNRTVIVSSDPWPGRTPSGCVSLPASGVATLANKAYVLGGLSFVANGCLDEQSAQTWAFDPLAPAGSQWTQGPDLSVARGYITPAVLGGKIYAIGGDINVAGTPTPIATVEAWQPPAGGWNDSAIADLPVPCDESQAFPSTNGPLKRGIVLATCGQWPNALPDTYFYDERTNGWSDIGAVNETRRNEAGALIPGGSPLQMLILGGYAADGLTALSSTEVGSGGRAASRPGFFRPVPGTNATPTTT